VTSAGDDWREARQQELAAHLGTEVLLQPAGEDPRLLDRAEKQLFTYESLEERGGAFRWPETNASGPAALYNWSVPSKGGVAAPGSLPLSESADGRLQHGPGYVWSEGALWYVPARPERAVFPLPPGTTETVVIPWQIESRHAHRIEIESEAKLRLVASGHEHVIRRTEEGWAQESGPHQHAMTAISTKGPASMSTRPARPRTGEPAETGDTVSGVDGTNERLAWPAHYPEAALAETGDGAHSHLVDPHDYWSGNFYLYGEDHRHEVTGWSVEPAQNHTHSLAKPQVPGHRPLWPSISRHEGAKLREETGNPYVANLRIKDGWTVAHVPEGFSEELVLRYDTGSTREIPRLPATDGDAIGLGPGAEATTVALTNVVDAYVGADLILTVRAEDDWTGGISGEKIRVSHDRGGETIVYTGDDGRATAHLPTPDADPGASTALYTITLELMDDGSVIATSTEDVELEFVGEIDRGYGYDFGYNYGQ